MGRETWVHEIRPGSFEPSRHFYPKALNAQIHPWVGFFFRLGLERIISRYTHLNPRVDPKALEAALTYEPKHFRWAGADLFHTTTASGQRRMVVVETNSCPSGNKSMPLVSEDNEQGGFRRLVQSAFKPLLERRAGAGRLAVLYDKNPMECSGYAAAIADLADEPVLLVPYYDGDPNPRARFVDGVLEVRPEDEWLPVRACMRYVTQRPWNRIPVKTKTRMLNPVIACLAGGRNKLVASKAYEFYNAELSGTGLRIFTPETIRDLSIDEIPLWVRRFGGQAVIKNPYSNAGQGVWTIVRDEELERFLSLDHTYDRFIVQSLIGNASWSSAQSAGRFYHVGTMPNRHGHLYAADVRMMIGATAEGFRPIAIYARRARSPLATTLDAESDSWDMLGTNLSIKNDDGTWASDTDRLMLMDRRDFNQLGLGPDDLIECFVQTTLASTAIDRMASTLLGSKGGLKSRLFRSLGDDASLLTEIQQGTAGATHNQV